MTIGQRIKQRREEKGGPLEELAARIGCLPTNVSTWEHNYDDEYFVCMRLNMFMKIAHALDMTVSELVGDEREWDHKANWAAVEDGLPEKILKTKSPLAALATEFGCCVSIYDRNRDTGRVAYARRYHRIYGGGVFAWEWDSTDFSGVLQTKYEKITHWMPAPKPKEE